MNNTPFGKFAPHLIAWVLFMAISFAFYLPYLTEGKALSQSDNTRAYGMQGESTKIYKETGVTPLWTNSQFSGMPAYQIKGAYKNNLTKYVYRSLMLFQGIVDVPFVILMAMLCCYLFLVVLQVDWRIAIIGSIAYGLSTYFCDIAEAGHSTKMTTMALVPGIFAGAILAFRQKYLIGGVLFGIFLSIGILANHIQIIYYAGLLLGILGIIEMVKAVRKQTVAAFAKSAGMLVVAALLAVLSNASMLWTTYEYSKETIRGKSELSSNAEKGDGLDKKYIWDWSYGIKESMTLLVHNFNGGGASHDMSGTEFYKRQSGGQIQQMIQQGYSAEDARKAAGQSLASIFYYGDQPFVGTAIYFGAVMLFFFFVGLVLVPGTTKWWLGIAAFFALTIAWGGNFFLNHFLVDYFPMFNKFRAVSMALGLSHLCVIALAVLAMQEVLNGKRSKAERQKAMYIGLGITGGLCLLALMMGAGDLSNPAKDGRYPAAVLDMVKADRAAMLRADALKSLVLILISAGLVWAYLNRKIKAMIFTALIGLLVLGDTWTAAKRIIFADKYETKVENPKERTATGADKQILDTEKDLHYRVLDLSRGNPFTSTEASYFHKSLGGYHAAKMLRYQEVIERYLNNPGKNLHIVGMLNGKYIMQDQEGKTSVVPVQNALGNAWFVNSYRVVENGDAEIAALADLKPRNEAVIQKQYASVLEGLSIQPDSAASIKLTSYHPDKMAYSYNANSEQLAVFSEIYYTPSKGWNLYLDGTDKKVDIIKANYLLRAARLPAGSHTLEMRFEPRSFYLGETLSLIASLVLLLGFLAGLFFYFKNNGLPDVNRWAEEVLDEAPKERLVRTEAKKGKKGKG
jgi:hypothetical protein